MANKTLYGQAWIHGNSVLQDQTVFEDGILTETKTVVLIDNIWEESLNGEGIPAEGASGKTLNDGAKDYQYNKKKNYFFWEYKMTNLDDEEIKVKLECPKPSVEFFEKNFFKDGQSGVQYRFYSTYDPELIDESLAYARHYGEKLHTSGVNMEKSSVIQIKEINLDAIETTNFEKFEGNQITSDLPKQTLVNNDLGDITNLLGLF